MNKKLVVVNRILKVMVLVAIAATWFKPERETSLLVWACIFLLFSISNDTYKE